MSIGRVCVGIGGGGGGEMDEEADAVGLWPAWCWCWCWAYCGCIGAIPTEFGYGWWRMTPEVAEAEAEEYCWGGGW